MKYVYRIILLIFASATLAFAARPLPADGHTGYFKALDYPMVQIGKDTLRLAPGARMFNPDNRVLMHSQLPAEANVLYQHDVSGLILNIWFLSDVETETLKKAGKKF
ncbi:MAG: hypothetical protein WCC58_07680 [Burkholderiales bacterium]